MVSYIFIGEKIIFLLINILNTYRSSNCTKIMSRKVVNTETLKRLLESAIIGSLTAAPSVFGSTDSFGSKLRLNAPLFCKCY